MSGPGLERDEIRRLSGPIKTGNFSMLKYNWENDLDLPGRSVHSFLKPMYHFFNPFFWMN